MLSINSLFATLTCIPIFLIARKTFGDNVAKWSAYAWGLNPYVWYWSIHWIWDTTFTPFILACVFLLALELQDWPGWQGWALFGALYGIGALANPTMLTFLPFCGLWIWRQRYRRSLPSVGGIVIASMRFLGSAVAVAYPQLRSLRTLPVSAMISACSSVWAMVLTPRAC